MDYLNDRQFSLNDMIYICTSISELVAFDVVKIVIQDMTNIPHAMRVYLCEYLIAQHRRLYADEGQEVYKDEYEECEELLRDIVESPTIQKSMVRLLEESNNANNYPE